MSLTHRAVSENKRLSFGQAVDAAILSVLGLIGVWVGTQIGQLTSSVNGLREELAVVRERTGDTRERLGHLEGRVERLEGRK